MRLICPNCGAQYEVPDEVIPETGRDVQCSNCGDTWFQSHPDHPVSEPEPEPEPPTAEDTPEITWDEPENSGQDYLDEPEPQDDPTPETEPETAEQWAEGESEGDTASDTAPEPTRRQLDPAIADVLREEADFAREARAAESGGGLETQPDLGLSQDTDDEDRRTREARNRMARLRGEDPSEQAEAPSSVPDAEDIDPASRRNLLPDIDEINSSLDAGGVGSHQDAMPSDNIDDLQPARPRKSGFRRGFSYAVLLALILFAIYYFAPKIAEMVPALAGPLEVYVEQVNALRVMLDGQFGWVRDWFNEMSSAPADSTE